MFLSWANKGDTKYVIYPNKVIIISLPLLMIHNIFAFLSLSCLRVTPAPWPGGWLGTPCVSGPGCLRLRLWRQTQSRIRHNKTSPKPEPGDINNIIFLLARARITMMEVSVPTLCRGKDRSLVKCPGVQPDRYSIFVLDIYFLNTDIICP